MKKSIFEYDNYRAYLRDFYAESKASNKSFSFRYFARLAGFKAGNVLKRVMDGQRNIAEHSIDKFIHALKLNREESLFFRSLVLLNQATTVDEKSVHTEQILRLKNFKRVHPLSDSQYNFYARWYFIVIWEMAGLSNFREDEEWIAKRIYPSISPSEVRRTLNELLKLGLLARDEKGRLLKTNAALATPNEVTSPAIAQFHREMMKRAAESIDRVARQDRDISGLTFTVSKESANKIKEMIQNFRKELAEVILRDDAPDSVYQLSFQFFPHVQCEKEPHER